jgi:hypothetical protein
MALKIIDSARKHGIADADIVYAVEHAIEILELENELLDDGTPLTDDVVEKLVADVYTALDRGAYKVIPNPHGPRSPLKVPPICRLLYGTSWSPCSAFCC